MFKLKLSKSLAVQDVHLQKLLLLERWVYDDALCLDLQSESAIWSYLDLVLRTN